MWAGSPSPGPSSICCRREPLIYVGDSARFPYGPKPVDEIRRYAIDIADYLVHRDVKMLVVACNSVEVSGLGDIAVRAGIPVVGVIDPGTRTAVHVTRNGRDRLDRDRSHGQERRVRSRRRSDGSVGGRCTRRRAPAFVEHVERGDTTSDALRTAAREYLVPLIERGIDTLILGCTHYPLLSGLLQLELGPDVVLVSSAEETAKDVYATLLRSGTASATSRPPPSHEFLSTGDPELFQRLAEVFLGPELLEVRAAQAQPVGGGAWN